MKNKFKKIYIEITNICNLSCSFCTPDTRKKEYMRLDRFDYILDQIKEYTSYICLHVKGEPLMHPNINEIIEMANRKGFQVNLTTNGTLVDYLETKNIRQINYSLQSTDDIDLIRKIIRKLRKFIAGEKIYLSLRLWSDEIKKNKQLMEMLLDEFDSICSISDIKDKKQLDNNIFISVEEEFKWPDINDEVESDTGYCYGLKSHFAILVDGTVVPCCLDYNGEINLGNIYKEKLNDILQTSRVEKIIKSFQNRTIEEELCKRCKYRNKF